MTALVSRMRLGALGGGGQQHRRRRGEEIRPVMLADAEHLQADLIGQLDLLHQVAQPLRRARGLPGGRVRRVLDEGIDADFHGGLSRRCALALLCAHALTFPDANCPMDRAGACGVCGSHGAGPIRGGLSGRAGQAARAVRGGRADRRGGAHPRRTVVGALGRQAGGDREPARRRHHRRDRGRRQGAAGRPHLAGRHQFAADQSGDRPRSCPTTRRRISRRSA